MGKERKKPSQLIEVQPDVDPRLVAYLEDISLGYAEKKIPQLEDREKAALAAAIYEVAAGRGVAIGSSMEMSTGMSVHPFRALGVEIVLAFVEDEMRLLDFGFCSIRGESPRFTLFFRQHKTH